MLNKLSARLQLMLAALCELPVTVCNSLMESLLTKPSAALLLHANLRV